MGDKLQPGYDISIQTVYYVATLHRKKKNIHSSDSTNSSKVYHPKWITDELLPTYTNVQGPIGIRKAYRIPSREYFGRGISNTDVEEMRTWSAVSKDACTHCIRDIMNIIVASSKEHHHCIIQFINLESTNIDRTV